MNSGWYLITIFSLTLIPVSDAHAEPTRACPPKPQACCPLESQRYLDTRKEAWDQCFHATPIIGPREA